MAPSPRSVDSAAMVETRDDVVTLRGVSRRFGTRLAVSELDLDVPRGTCFGLLGPNGAGKTTTLRMIYGVARPTSGSVRVFGIDVTRAPRAVRARLGVTLQENVQIEALSAPENLRIFARHHLLREPQITRRVEELVDYLELGSHLDVPVRALSGGFRRRLSIAMSLLNQPELLVLDEPFSGLDPLGIEAMSALLVEQSQRGVAILFSSHQLDLVEDICEDVVIIDHGKVVLDGDVDRLRAETGKIRLEVAIDGEAWSPKFDGLVEISRSHRHASFLADKGMRIEEILGRAATEGNVTSLSYGPPHLSDLFREAVGR